MTLPLAIQLTIPRTHINPTAREFVGSFKFLNFQRVSIGVFMERDSAGGLCVVIQLKDRHLYMYKDWLFFSRVVVAHRSLVSGGRLK
jgi:hypothetical protein